MPDHRLAFGRNVVPEFLNGGWKFGLFSFWQLEARAEPPHLFRPGKVPTGSAGPFGFARDWRRHWSMPGMSASFYYAKQPDLNLVRAIPDILDGVRRIRKVLVKNLPFLRGFNAALE